MGSDGAIIDRLVMLLRRFGPSQELEDSVPRDIYRKALRRCSQK